MTYSFIYSNISKKSNYKFLLRVSKGLYRFAYSFYNEIYHEKPYVDFMYPQHDVIYEKSYIDFVFPEHIGIYDKLNICLSSEYKNSINITNKILSNINKTFIPNLDFLSDIKSKYIEKNNDFNLDTEFKTVKNDWFEVLLDLQRELYALNDYSVNVMKRCEFKSGVLYIINTYFNSIHNSIFKTHYNFLEINNYDGYKLYDKLLKKSDKHIYKITDSMLKSDKYIYKVTDSILKSDKYIYNIIDSILKSDKYIYNVIDSILKSDKYIYNVIDSILKSDKYIYNVIDSILKSDKYGDVPKDYMLNDYKYGYIINNTDVERFNDCELINNILNFLFEDYKIIEAENRNLNNIMTREVFDRELFREFISIIIVNPFDLAENNNYNISFIINKLRNLYIKENLQYKITKNPKDSFIYNKIFTFEKLFKDIKNYIKFYKSTKDLKPINNINNIHYLEKDYKKYLEESIIKTLIRYTIKESLNNFNSKLTNRYIYKNSYCEDNEKYMNRYIFKHLFNDTDINELIVNNIRDALFYIVEKLIERFDDKNSYDDYIINYFKRTYHKSIVEKSIIAPKKLNDLDKLKSIIAFGVHNDVDLSNEHNFKLWQRFWFLYADDIYDNKILPCCDYPYEDKPITFEGFDDLMPKDWQVVYPETFWLGIDHHPIQEGKELALREIPLAINIMIEIINIFILMWYRFYPAFWGWTGTQAVLGITSSIFEWITLETSRVMQDNKNSRQHYDRCYRWLRWEAEKMALMARNDMELKGNYYVGLLLEELVNYMLDHHFDVMPIFIDVNKMDEWRRMFNRNLQNDITWVLDKVKGIRHKVIVGKEQKYNV